MRFSSTRHFLAFVALVLLAHAPQANADSPQPHVPPSNLFVRESAVQANPTLLPATGTATGSTPILPLASRLAPPTVLPKPQKEDGERILKVLQNQDVCQFVIDLTVKTATLEEIAAQVEKKLSQPAPKIEVRGALPIRLSFALKKSKVGDALGSAAALAGAKLWVFGDHYLLAPESALSDEEQAVMKQSIGGAWNIKGRIDQQFFNADGEIRRVFSTLISDEVKAANVVAQTNTTAGAGTAPGPKITFGSLSPDAQAMLQQLVKQTNKFNESEALQAAQWGTQFIMTPFQLSPDTEIQANMVSNTSSKAPPEDWLNITNPSSKAQQGWALKGNGWSSSGGGTPPPKQPEPPPPFLDPSAGKS